MAMPNARRESGEELSRREHGQNVVTHAHGDHLGVRTELGGEPVRCESSESLLA
jgi:hypothetical protein